MQTTRAVQVVATNDLFGAFDPDLTSYGRLPGATAVRRLVDRLREDGPTLWVDAGDFSAGGVLAPATAGTAGFLAAAELGIDTATAGNHEFDWGTDHLRRWAGRCGFPVLSATYDAGLPAVSRHDVGGTAVAVIGVVVEEYHGVDTFGLTERPELAGRGRAVAALARRLRAEVDLVVAALHDGVDWDLVDGRPVGRPERLRPFVDAVRGHVDLLVAGHTLGRWVGPLFGLPCLQPWAFGTEVATATLDRGRPTRIRVGRTPVAAADARWDGAGEAVLRAARDSVVGRLPRSVAVAPGRDLSLAELTAAGARRITGADIAVVTAVEAGCAQPPLDGVGAYLAAGDVTRADVLRMLPWADGDRGDGLWLADLPAAELARLVGQLAADSPYGPPAVAGVVGRGGVVALSSNTVARARRVDGLEATWARADVGLRDALTAAVAR